MTRSRRQLSRALLAALAIILALGLIFWIHNMTEGDDADSTAVASAPGLPQVAVAPATQPAPAVFRTPDLLLSPTTSPSGQPAAEPGAAQPTAPEMPNAEPQPAAARTVISQNPIPDGKAKLDAGDLLAAREILNDALVSSSLSAADAASAKAMLKQINQSILFSAKFFPADQHAGSYKVRSGDRLQRIGSDFDVPWELIGRLNGVPDPRKLRADQTLKIIKGPFHAVVDKSDYLMDLWLGPPEERGSLYVTSYPVGLGADDSTPSGVWIVESHKKIRNPTYYSPRGEGIIAADDPANPLGEYWIGLTGIDGQALGQASYGIHGTIEPHTIGKQESMGCIRLLNEDVAQVYELLAEGKSTVVVRD